MHRGEESQACLLKVMVRVRLFTEPILLKSRNELTILFLVSTDLISFILSSCSIVGRSLASRITFFGRRSLFFRGTAMGRTTFMR
jgi:hypothetical protein